MIKELDTSKLKEGMIVDNYKELCTLVGQETKSSNSKNSQLKEFKRFFDFEKDDISNKYIIYEIYNKPFPPGVKANAKYLQYIQDILLCYLANNREKCVYKTRTQLLQVLGMVNKKYKNPDINKKLLKQVGKFELGSFYERSDIKLNHILESSLNSLSKRLLIDYQQVYIIIDEKGNKHEANDDEIKKILQIKRNNLKMLGYEKENVLYYVGDQVKKFHELNRELYKEEGWNNVYRYYKIIYDYDNAVDAIQEDMEKMKLNGLIVNAVNENAITKYDKALDRLPMDYIEMQKFLADELLKLNKKNNDLMLIRYEEDLELEELFK